MSWTVSASGTKQAAKEMIERQVHASHPKVAPALCALVDDLAGDQVTVSGSGFEGAGGGMVRLSITAWTEQPKAEAKAA